MTGSRTALAIVALLAAPGVLIAQGTPQGPEFRVNTVTSGNQRIPAVASGSAGNFVVAWVCVDQCFPLLGLLAQRYDASGLPLGGEFQVAPIFFGGPLSFYPSVASDAAGNFVVAWHDDYAGYGISDEVFLKRYASTGSQLSYTRVNSYTTGNQRHASVASDSAGNFVVVWQSAGQDGSLDGVFAQRFSTAGPLGGEFRVNTHTTGFQRYPSVASDSSGNFVVVWEGQSPSDPSLGVFAQRFSAAGVPLGPEFRVNTYTTNAQHNPSVAADSVGDFVVAWTSLGQDGFWEGVFAQRYAASGSPLGAEFQVNTYTAYNQYLPSVASDSAGNFVITWQSNDGQDGSGSGVFGQRYASTGAPLGGEFRVNTFTTNAQSVPSVASDSAGHFVVTWSSLQDPGGTTGIYAQRYSMIVPVELQSFTVE